MKFKAFERHAREAFDEIPEVYLQGIDGMTVSRATLEHPDLPGVYTLGECVTEEHLSDYGSADTTRSVIALYWGSFVRVAEQNPDFDWEEEIWETVTHELRHHLESLAGDDALEDVDYAADESFKRFEGQPFDPWYWQKGEREGPGLYRVEKSWYVELVLTDTEFAACDTLEFAFGGDRWVVDRPEVQGDVHFVLVSGPGEEDDDVVELVLIRRRGFWQSARRLFRRGGPVVLESEASARRPG